GPDDGEQLAGRVPLAEPAPRRPRGNLAGRTLPTERLRPLRHGRQRLGVDGGRVRAADAAAMLRAAPQRRRAVRPQGDQGRLAPLRPELLLALPPSSASE